MEHLKVIDLKNGYFKLIPEKDYILYDAHYTFISAVVRDITGWSAIKM